MLDRRSFCAAAAAAAFPPRPIAALVPPHGPRAPIQAVAFDGFVLFDPRPAGVLAESLVPGHGAALLAAWRTRLFEYQWLRALGGRYADFRTLAGQSLDAAVRALGLALPASAQRDLVTAQTELAAWPDAAAGLEALRAAGLRTALLSNMTADMLRAALDRSRLGGLVDAVLSTDALRTYKPDPRAYALGEAALALPRTTIAFAAFAAWDAAGAAWFGYPTIWVNRAQAAAEALDAGDVIEVRGMQELVRRVVVQATGN